MANPYRSLRHLAVALAAGLIAASCAAQTASAAPGARRAGNRFELPSSARQLIVVSSPTTTPAAPGYLATFATYDRVGPRSPWRPVFRGWRAETGSGHLLRVRHEGDHATPIGVFGIGLTMYGNEPDPGGLHYRYHQLVCGDWWDEDPFSPRYNQFVYVPCGVAPGFAGWSEALWTETVAYPYFAVIKFNMDPTVAGPAAPGSGIFLHSWMDGPTEGCVALPEAELLDVLRWLKPSADPVIEIGTDTQVTPAASS